MAELTDQELLTCFARNGDEAAFATLVTRHVNLVWSAARRFTGDDTQAGEITQAVFIVLARKAGKLSPRIVLTGWLYQTARLTAANALKENRRRQQREHQAYLEATMTPNETNEAWQQLAPGLDEAMHALRTADRDAVLLRYFENRSLADVGAALGVSEDAARVRVNRALEKLRALLAKQGIKFGVTAIAGAVAANAVSAAPATLAASITTAALAGTSLTLTTITMTTLQKIAVTAALVAVVGAGLYEFNRAAAARRSKVASPPAVSTAIANAPVKHTLQMPPPKVRPAPAEKAPATMAAVPATGMTNRLARIMSGELPRLTTAQAEAYVQAQGRTAASLLAAFKTSGDPEFLREAMQRFPNDAQVAFAAVTNGKLSADEQRQWLDTFARNDPGNALPDYLSALAWFNAGDSEKAAGELLASAGKKNFQDYSTSGLTDLRQAYLFAGYSEGEATVAANLGLPLPLAGDLRQLGKDIVSLADGYQQTGDTASAQSALLLGASLGQFYADSSSLLIQKLVGQAIETQALKALPADMAFGADSQTVQDELNQINRQKNMIKQLIQQTSGDFASMPNWSGDDLTQYFTLVQQKGEVAALQWLANRKTTH